jgi:hypothetical protein
MSGRGRRQRRRRRHQRPWGCDAGRGLPGFMRPQAAAAGGSGGAENEGRREKAGTANAEGWGAGRAALPKARGRFVNRLKAGEGRRWRGAGAGAT